MTDEPGRAPADQHAVASAPVPDALLHAALEAVIAVAREAEDASDASRAIVDRLAETLSLARVRLMLVSEGDDAGRGPRLEPAAAAGSHAVIARDMPSVPLDAANDLARVASSGKPEYHGDVHGLGDPGATARGGLGRWRTGVTTQASAVLPLIVRGGVLGVLSLEWPTPRAFDPAERADLEAVATATSLTLHSFLAEEHAALPHRASAGCTPGPTAQLTVTSDGMVVPAGIPASWIAAPALRLQVGAATPEPDADTEEMFWDVSGLRGGLVMLSLGMADSPRGGAAEVAETARHMLRASALQGAGPARGMGLLAGWLAASGPGSSWISAIVCEIDVRRASARWCAAGSVALVSRYSDGRFDVVTATHPPLGSSVAPDLEERDALLLPGDHVVLTCGDMASVASGPGRMRVDEALSGETDDPTAPLGPLLDVLRTPRCAQGAIVVDVGT